MPRTQVWLYRTADGRTPVREWLRVLRARDAAAHGACRRALVLLTARGWEARRPHVDYLRDAIYELRARRGRVNMRILYFFHGRDAVVLTSALTKENVVPDEDIERALRRRQEVVSDPETHVLKGWSIDDP